MKALPGSDLNVQSFAKRGEPPYLTAFDALAAAVHTTLEATGGAPEEPYARAELTIGCYVGSPKSDGFYRPQLVTTLFYVLEPIYRALCDSKVITGMGALYEIRTYLERDSSREGFFIQLTGIQE